MKKDVVLVKFLQAAFMGGQEYKNKQVVEVTEALEKDPNFHKYIKLGLIVEAQSTAIITPETLEQRQHKLAAKLLKPKAEKPEAPEGSEEGSGDAGGEQSQDGEHASEEGASEESEHESETEAEADHADAEHKGHAHKKNKKKK